MSIHELVEQLKNRLTPGMYAQNQRDLDDLAWKINVEKMDREIGPEHESH